MSQDQGQARWQAIWRTRNPTARALLPIAWVYGAMVVIRRWLYAHRWMSVQRLEAPVVVVGNVVVGGAGKTPTVLALIRHLRSSGWHPGVVSRGYGREGESPLEVLPSTHPGTCGDEPALIRRQADVPVFVARQRSAAAKALLRTHPNVDVILCDDGLQHLALGRDLAIAVFDDRGTGNGWLLPAGLLREPWPVSAGATFAPDLVLQQSNTWPPVQRANPGGIPCFTARRSLSPEVENALGERAPLASMRGDNLTAVAGIARPQAFFDMLEATGVVIRNAVALPDHADESRYADILQSVDGPLLCTEKDAVKLFELARQRAPNRMDRIWAVPLMMQVDPEFFSAIDDRLASFRLG
ncbi:MAG: tetraacyldisaccharide 4'-kinase [Burkholderiaceae bacterium]